MEAAKHNTELEAFLASSTFDKLLDQKLEEVLSGAHSRLEGSSPPKEFVTSWQRTREKLLIPISSDNRLDGHEFIFEYRPIPGRKFSADLLIIGSTDDGKGHITVVEIVPAG